MTSPAARSVFGRMILSFATLSFFSISSSSHTFEPIDGQGIVDACLEISAEDRNSGNTMHARSGWRLTIDSLEDELVRQLQALFTDSKAKPFGDGTSKSRVGFRKLIDEMRSSYQTLQSSIWNERRGTAWTLMPLLAYEQLVEDMLKTVIAQRNWSER